MDRKISRIKRVIIIVYCLAVALACTFVPWKGEFIRTGSQTAIGYSPIWSPPPAKSLYPTVDFGRIIVEIVAVTALGGMLFVLAGGFEKHSSTPKSGHKPAQP